MTEGRVFNDGEVMFREGDPRRGAWTVAGGKVRLSKDTPAGPVTLAVLNAGAELGDGEDGVWETTATAVGEVMLTPRAAAPAVGEGRGQMRAVANVVARLRQGVGWKQPAASVARDLLEFQPDIVEIEERPIPKAAEWTVLAVVGLIVTAVLWASLAKVDRVVSAEGRLITTSSKLVVQPLETGIVRSILVRVGQPVKQGDVLATLDATFTEADVASSRHALTSLEAQVNRLEAEMNGPSAAAFSPDPRENALQKDILKQREAEAAATLAAIDGEIGALSAELTTNRREQQDAEKTLDIARKIERMRAELFERNTGSQLQLLEAQTKRASAERDINHLVNTAKQIEQKLAAAREKRNAAVSERKSKVAQELQAARRERDKVVEDLKKHERRSSLVQLTAPVDAVVLEVAPRSVGSVISQAEPFITMVPLDAPLEAEVDIQPQDVALLRTGDSARIKLEALPYQRHGVLVGRLDVLSGDVLKADGKGPGGQPAPGQQAQVYRGRLVISERNLRNVPKDFRLIPGMSVTAEIKIGSRRVISYIIYPIFRALDESFREP